MVDITQTRTGVRGISVDECSITSKDGKKEKLNFTDIYYYESILNESIRSSIYCVDAGRSIRPTKEEKVNLNLKDENQNKINVEFYCNTISPFGQQTTRSVSILDLASKEALVNYDVVLNKRFDGKISDHIINILNNFLKTNKNKEIEPTINNYNFNGNNQHPFYTLIWLSKFGIPTIPNAKGNSAGFLFWETSKGYKFKSIDNLLSDTDLGTANKKEISRYVYTRTSDSNIPPGFNGKLLEYTPIVVSGTSENKRQIGAYSTRTILFDPFNCYYETVYPNAEESEKQNSLRTAGEQLPRQNKELENPNSKKRFSRTQYMLIDRGTLPSGNTSQQIEKSKEQNFDPKNILNQSVMRYNQLFSTKIEVTIVPNYSLNAGDLIRVEIAGAQGDTLSEKIDKKMSGNYLIAELCHYINIKEGGYTKLTLVRDSIGKRPPSIHL